MADRVSTNAELRDQLSPDQFAVVKAASEARIAEKAAGFANERRHKAIAQSRKDHDNH